jgi:Ca-activated chloride channel family protein
VRGIGPNGARDRVVLVPAGVPPEAGGPSFFPHENVEATLDAPDQPGAYELRYVMDAPVSGLRVLATRAVRVE